MANDMTGPGTGGGPFASLFQKGGAHKRVGHGPRQLEGFYLMQLVPALLIVLFGVITMWVASQAIEDASFKNYVAGIGLGLAAAYFVWRYDYRSLAGMTTVLFILACVLMLLPKVPFLGIEAKGMVGWVKIPLINFRFQPSEPGKLVIIFLMAAAAGQYNGKIDSMADYLKLCGTLAVPVFLMVITDLGTGLIMFIAGAAIISCSGAPLKWVGATWALVVGMCAFVVIESQTPGLPHILKDYQLKRLLVFTNHDLDPTDSGHQLQQSLIAVGSGGFLGKGLGNASQALSGFLPEAHTDFIFALFAEQFGFVGSVLLLGLFCWMILSTVFLAMRIDAVFSKLVLVGVAAMWAFQVLQEVGMCIGIMPITGIPLPFMSYGSSSMVVQLMAVGIVQSVWRHRQKSA